jgi:hypothetical protein
MSNIAGKAYAMNVVTPIRKRLTWLNKIIFWVGGTKFFKSGRAGLQTLSLIHYARWTIVNKFPRLSEEQPREDLNYNYMFFFSNFNGSWEQYVDSFSTAIPYGLDLFWAKNIRYPNSIPEQAFYNYITYNQVWTNHYYNAYPLASSNDVKSGKKVKAALNKFVAGTGSCSPGEFRKQYNQLLTDLQHDLSVMAPTPIVSLASEAVENRRRKETP